MENVRTKAPAHTTSIIIDHVFTTTMRRDFVFRSKCNEKEQHALRCITEGGEGDGVGEQNFPLVHMIVFRLSSKTLIAKFE